MKKLTNKRLKEILHYDPWTGVWVWKEKVSQKIRMYSVAGYLSNGYRIIMINGLNYRACRLAWFYMEGYWPEHDIDHKDRNPVNERWDNLRHMTHSCNLRNQRFRSDNTSGITGVSWNKALGMWNAYIQVGKKIHLGYFDDLTNAVKARWEAEIKYNFPNCSSSSSAYKYLNNI